MTVIRLDLDALVQASRLTPEEAARLAGLALPDNRAGLAANILLIFGAVAVAIATIALVPNAATGLLLAAAALGGAEALRHFSKGESFALLAIALALMGTLGLAGWVAWEFEDAPVTAPALLVTLILSAGAIRYRSAFLAALSMVALGPVLGTGTGYWHASYALFVEEPVLSILIFGALSAGLYRLRRELAPAWQSLATSAARTGLILLHFSFWVGSLWGDVIGDAWLPYDSAGDAGRIAPAWFSVGWAALSLALALKTRRGGFLSVSALVFLTIHAYTQYFETFGAEPATLLVAGIALIGLAIVTAKLTRFGSAKDKVSPAG
ncbi:hypothetical protein K1X12_15460 [Hyphomonas sp. WL0036]|uniref:hypothetical protein n=1 Tax=Hyphomonas sediminis TaxID=2866160 RepID=UPI001C8274CA|nr:hypothetical protein [Hyphomonas sediminis]MBY9068298.1 hypothetical protein [Hyphomonas sediminis]